MKNEAVYLLHVRDAIRRIQAYTADGRDAFLADSKTQDAVMRNLEIIGEAVKRLPVETTDLAPDIPWKQIAGMRDVLIHHYFGVKIDTVWEVVGTHLTPLSTAVERLIALTKSIDAE